jgi:hypothetical protein
LEYTIKFVKIEDLNGFSVAKEYAKQQISGGRWCTKSDFCFKCPMPDRIKKFSFLFFFALI